MPDLHTAKSPPPSLQCLLLGRAEDYELKGLDIAARALASLDFRALESPPVLLVRGAPRGTGDELQENLRKSAERADLQVKVREYTSDAERVAIDLRSSALVLGHAP